MIFPIISVIQKYAIPVTLLNTYCDKVSRSCVHLSLGDFFIWPIGHASILFFNGVKIKISYYAAA